MRRPVLLVLVLAVLLATPNPAGAGGSWMAPARDRYEAGEVATVVGYTGGGQLGWIEDGPYEAILEPGRHRLGPAVLQETGRGGWLSLRVAVSFVVPDVAPGAYDVVLENAEGGGLGDIISGPLFVGIDPPHPVDRDWPLDDPARSGATAEVPLPPAPTTTTTTTEAPRELVPPTTVVPLRPVPTTTGPDPVADAAPGWVLLGPGAAVLALALTAGLVPRRRT